MTKEEWLEKNTFFCAAMEARISESACRQARSIYTYRLYTDPDPVQDDWGRTKGWCAGCRKN